jgi:[ribosomal protein S5]-alanine N-acetyltransferase
VEQYLPFSIETERLYLRPSELRDLGTMHRVWADSEVRRFLWDNEIISRAKAKSVLQASIDSFSAERFGIWVISIKPSGEIAGFCGMRRTYDSGEVEVLYGVLPTFMRRGITSEATAALLRYGIQGIGLESIIARMDAPNLASERLMQKVGMTFRRKFIENGRVMLEYIFSKEHYFA